MTNSSLDAAAESFQWNYLRCADLKYPVASDFQLIHVYRGGEVLLKNGTQDLVHSFSVEQGLKKHAEAPGPKDISLLREAGYLIEVTEDTPAFYAARTAYHNESSRRQAAFKAALFEREGVADNPRAELCYSKAYERSHSKGLAEVANTFIDLAELIR